MQGWIKIHRCIWDNPILMKDNDRIIIWLYLLTNATHKEYDVIVGKERKTLLPGQLITSRKSLSQKINVSESKIERCLKLFEIEQQIEQQSFSTNRIITVLNWNKYQYIEQQFEQQANSERTASEQRANTNKNIRIKEHKNIIKDNIKDTSKFSYSDYGFDDEVLEVIKEFEKMRIKIKKPMTDFAKKRMCNDLLKISSDKETQIKSLEQSIIKCYTGVFPVKEGLNGITRKDTTGDIRNKDFGF